MAFAYTGWILRLPAAAGAALSAVALIAFYALNQWVSNWLGLIPGAVLFAIVLDQRSLAARMLNTETMSYLGRISYSLYLVHPFAVFGSLMVAARLEAHGMARPVVFVLYVVVGLTGSIVAAAISYELLEVRLRRLLANWAGASGQPRTVVAGAD